MFENLTRPGEEPQPGDRVRSHKGPGLYDDFIFNSAPVKTIRHITGRAFLARLAPWWEIVEKLKASSAAFRLDWALLEMAGYVDLDDTDNRDAFERLKVAVDTLAASPEFSGKSIPAFDLDVIQKDGVEKEAYNGPL